MRNILTWYSDDTQGDGHRDREEDRHEPDERNNQLRNVFRRTSSER